MFRNKLAETIFNTKYRHEGAETWPLLCSVLVEDVVRDRMSKYAKEQLKQYIIEMKFIPGGRYLYYAGRAVKFFNNCYLLRAEEDTREDWADLSWKVERCLSTGGGIGVDYSIYRERGAPLKRTGGQASGPVSKMMMTNEIGRVIRQGAGRRSAIYASLDWNHPDAQEFLYVKDWDKIKIPGTDKSLWDAKSIDFDWPCPLDMTNISLNYNDKWLENPLNDTFLTNVSQALRTGEPGFSFNFGSKQRETLRNACTEVCSEDDSDVCNLGSINFANIDSIDELRDVIELSTAFLLCGTMVADLPYDKVRMVREKNRRLGLGLMGLHEWLLKRGQRYEVTPELHQWLHVYRDESNKASAEGAERFGISKPVANRAIAPTGTIGMLAGTTTGIEPLYAVAYKRRYIDTQGKRKYQYAVDSIAQELIQRYSIDPDSIESAIDLAKDYERRIKFQADIQDYVDMSISSTINLPNYGSDFNNPDLITSFATTLANYAPRLRGFTCYPDGARGGQPLVSVSYKEAITQLGTEFEEHVENNDICLITGKGGTCGI